MKTMIQLDTDTLRSTVVSAEQTNNQITQAMNLLNQIVIHNDWECQERDAINNNTVIYQRMVAQVQANSTLFYNAIKRSSQAFDEKEQSLITKTNGVDELISSILCVNPAVISSESTAASEVSIVDFGNVSGSMSGGGGGHSFGTSGTTQTGGGRNG